MTDRVLDWKPRFDPKSLNFKVSKLTDSTATRNRIWKRDTWLDQGQEGACVGFSGAHVMSTTPRAHNPRYGQQDAEDLYHAAQQNDQWPGENYEGSSVLGGMQALKVEGRIDSYHWCTTLTEALHAVSYLGPLQIGVNWYNDMFEPDAKGFLRVSGKLAGGHAICVGGISVDKQAVLLYNSWGKSWGNNGNAWLAFEDLDTLLHQDAEFALPKKVKS